jgi:hypothetical protein
MPVRAGAPRMSTDPPCLAAARHNGIAVVVIIDDVDFRTFWQADGAILFDLTAFWCQ